MDMFSTRLKTRFCGLEFEHPFVLASAPPTASGQLIRTAFNYGWAGAVTKTVKPDAMELSDVSPRFSVLRDSQWDLNGFSNIELVSLKPVGYWETEVRSLKEQYPRKIVIVSIMGDLEKRTWQQLAGTFEGAGADALELNFSCPHGLPEKGVGAAIGQHADLTESITRWVREAAGIPVIVKLTPNVTDVAEIAVAAQRGGADALAAINTVQCLIGVDLERLEPLPSVGGKSTFGGYSGRAVKPIGLRVVAQAAAATGLPVMGMGGITTWEDAAEYMAVGAGTVQVCTAVMARGFSALVPMLKGLDAYLSRKGMASPGDLCGAALGKLARHDALDRAVRMQAWEAHPEKCTLCYRCTLACSDAGANAITLEGLDLQIDESRCDGCSLCTYVCPTHVLELREAPRGKAPAAGVS
jgi:dihydropyrimidine dehydrogenase (NAD+) subunit PreA